MGAITTFRGMPSRVLVCMAALFLACLVQTSYADSFPMPLCHGFKLKEASIDDIQAQFQSGQLTSRQLVKCYMDRINLINPHLKAIGEINPDLYDIADALDAERAAGNVRGPLHGIPVVVKDNIATKDKMQTTAGSLALLGCIVPRDAFVVAQLRKAGAIILGKGNMSEWADIRASVYSEGYSARFGQSRNCYNLSQTPAGSSSGPAHAVSANLVTVGLGTETDGSVVGPAEFAAIIGIKPTVGLTSRSGVVPESHNQDTVGVFARTTKDAAYVLEAIKGHDPMDPVTAHQDGKVPQTYTDFVSTKSALNGVRFGIPWDILWTSPSTLSQLPKMFGVLKAIQNAGGILVNGTNIKNPDQTLFRGGWDWYWQTDGNNPAGKFANQSEFTVVGTDFYNDINSYLSDLTNCSMHNLQDLIDFNNNTDAEKGPAFTTGSDVFQLCQNTGGVMNQTYHAALKYIHRTTRKEGIDYALAGSALPTPKPVDILIIPTDPASANTQLAAMAGYPMITIPVSKDPYSIPFGISLYGTAFSEPDLIKYGSALDDLLRARTLPQFYNFDATSIPQDPTFNSFPANQVWPDLSGFEF